MKEKLLEKIESLNEMEKYQEIIDLIETLPAEQLNTELMGELGRAYNNIEEYEKGLEILEILKKCYENKFLVFIDNEDFFETKAGIIANLEDNKIKMKEIDKYGNFHKNSEIYFDEIQLLAVKNYRLGV